MSDNPLEFDAAREQRIRERAYHLWEADGRPEGHDQEYWERAEELIGMEDSPGAGQLPRTTTHEDGVIDEASLEENLGEFPNRMTDQGERKETPNLKNRRNAR